MEHSADAVLSYHQRTKHQLNAYAKGPESLDWDDQPNPFRRFTGCDLKQLPPPGNELSVLFADLDKPEQIPSQPLTLNNVGLLLELSAGHYVVILPVGTCIRPKLIYYVRIIPCYHAASTIISVTIMRWSGVANLTTMIMLPEYTLACRPFTGAKLGNMENVHSVIANTISVMRWRP